MQQRARGRGLQGLLFQIFWLGLQFLQNSQNGLYKNCEGTRGSFLLLHSLPALFCVPRQTFILYKLNKIQHLFLNILLPKEDVSPQVREIDIDILWLHRVKIPSF